MSRGSLYDFLHKQRCTFKLPALLRVAIDVSKGMNYLHQNNIIHRDLKAANLLMDENEVRNISSLFTFWCIPDVMYLDPSYACLGDTDRTCLSLFHDQITCRMTIYLN